MAANTSDRTCAWALKHELEREYHDTEWGVPVYDDQAQVDVALGDDLDLTTKAWLKR